ncbi:AsmA family protein [Kordiimonas marina]|uniref:AsmA family protein n=1 Tax=Kordiimonas marina TaxID=2872312 RepID=UPI001FF60F2A|nr:AsmA family protein [Kordiimonas marina]
MKQNKLAKIAYWVAGSIVGLIILLSVLLNFLDWNQYRSTLAAMASDQLGMRVELAGDVKLALFPHPLVSARSVRITPEGAASTDGAVATADRIEMKLGLSELLSGQIAVSQLNLDGLSLKVAEDADGSWRVKGWPQRTDTGGTPTAIQLDKLQVNGGRINIQPYGTPARVVEDLSFELSGMVPSGPLEWQGTFVSAGEKVTTDGRMRPSPERDDFAFKSDFTLQGGTMTLSGRVGAADGAGRIQLSGDSLKNFLSAARRVFVGGGADVTMPDMGFSLDVQADRKGDVTHLVSRQVELGSTQGRLDLTLAQKGGQPHVAGALTLGIIDLKPWADAFKTLPVKAEGTPAQAQSSAQPSGSSPAQSSTQSPAPASVQSPAKGKGQAQAMKMPLTGTLDISVEALQIGGDAVQHLEAVAGLAPDGPYVTSLQGLMPGGSAVSFQGHVALKDGGEGQVRMTSGNLQAFLKWLGSDVSKSVQPGRLATADLSGTLTVSADDWSLKDLTGKVDTMALKGHISGARDDGMPTDVALTVDQVNLDAYMAKAGKGEADFAALMPLKPMAFDLQAGALLWQGSQFSNVHLNGKAGGKHLSLEAGDVSYEDGRLALAGDLRHDADTWVADLNLNADKWRLPFVRAFMPEAKPYLTALRANSVSGKVSLTGPMSNLRLSSHLDQGVGTWVLNGSAGVKGGALDALNVQGTVSHKNLAPLMHLLGLKDARNLPASLTVSAARQEAGAPLALRLSGDLAGGQIIADGRMAPAGRKIQVTYDHKVAAQAFRRFGLGLAAPEPAEPVHADLTLVLEEGGWRLDGVDMRNGGASLRGALAGKGTADVTGSLKLAGYRVRTGRLGSAAPETDNSFQMPTGWEGYSGKVALAIDSLAISGQRLDAPHATAVADKGTLTLDLGADAKLNGAPAAGSFTLKDGKIPVLNGRMKLDSVDIGSFFKAQGLGGIASGSTGFTFDFDAKGASGDAILRSAKGHGVLKGRAGTLNFLSVPQLVQEIRSAPSGLSFLNVVGGLLRTGQTTYSDMDASFTLDGGTALVETAKAAGTWGNLTLDGQINLLARQMDMKGVLALTSPPDTPAIPVTYKGRLDDPAANWTSRALEKFVISGVESRLRSSLFKEQQAQKTGEGAEANPGAAVFGRAFDMLMSLKKKQETADTKKKDDTAKKQEPGSKPK